MKNQIVNAFARLAAAHTRDAQWADANASKLIGALQEREALLARVQAVLG